ncbi:MAG TPA: aldehyde dehydrogenase family protein [Trebonia sp.]|jgi:hypothetical protein|nr:aldehyde dehydrogenase family protein [Trebonia sp.]
MVGADAEIGDAITACPAKGNGPLVVLDDADLNAAASAAVFGLFFHAGQICLTAGRLIVDRAVHDGLARWFSVPSGRLVPERHVLGQPHLRAAPVRRSFWSVCCES